MKVKLMADFRDRALNVQQLKAGFRKLYEDWDLTDMEKIVTEDFRFTKAIVMKWREYVK